MVCFRVGKDNRFPALFTFIPSFANMFKILIYGDGGVNNKYVYPTEEERRKLLDSVNEPYERFIREDERRRLTALGKVSVWRWEQEERFPKRVKLGPTSNTWRLSEILHWLKNPPVRDLSKKKQTTANQ